jgi:hypothetical protein
MQHNEAQHMFMHQLQDCVPHPSVASLCTTSSQHTNLAYAALTLVKQVWLAQLCAVKQTAAPPLDQEQHHQQQSSSSSTHLVPAPPPVPPA